MLCNVSVYVRFQLVRQLHVRFALAEFVVFLDVRVVVVEVSYIWRCIAILEFVVFCLRLRCVLLEFAVNIIHNAELKRFHNELSVTLVCRQKQAILDHLDYIVLHSRLARLVHRAFVDANINGCKVGTLKVERFDLLVVSRYSHRAFKVVHFLNHFQQIPHILLLA